MKLKRRSFFGMLAGLFCLPLVKPRHHKRTKYFDIPDGYDWLRLIDCKKPGHIHCYDTGSIDLGTIHENRRHLKCTWECMFEGHDNFFRVHTSKRQPPDDYEETIPPFGSPFPNVAMCDQSLKSFRDGKYKLIEDISFDG